MIALLTSHPLALALLVAGFALLVVEVCVPGFGVSGVLGILLSIVALYLMGPPPALLLAIVGVYVLLLLIALAMWMRRLGRGGASKSKLVLRETATRARSPEGEEVIEPARLLGEAGRAQTPLRPAGIAEIAGARLNVITEGDYVDAGAPVRVVRVEGNRIVVTVARSE